jgi:hypothetical protein
VNNEEEGLDCANQLKSETLELMDDVKLIMTKNIKKIY